MIDISPKFMVLMCFWGGGGGGGGGGRGGGTSLLPLCRPFEIGSNQYRECYCIMHLLKW